MQALASFFGFSWGTPPVVEAPEASRGKKGKTIIPVKLKPGGLSRFGYHAQLSLRSRHTALLRAARSEGFLPIIRRLNVIATLNKNQAPRYSKIFKRDQEWLSAYYRAIPDEKVWRSKRRSLRVARSSKITASKAAPSSGGTLSRLSAQPEEPLVDDEEDYDMDDEEFDYDQDKMGPADDDEEYEEDEDYDEDE